MTPKKCHSVKTISELSLKNMTRPNEETVERLKASIEFAKRLKEELEERIAEMTRLLEKSERTKSANPQKNSE